MVFAIHWHESAMDIHVFLIPILNHWTRQQLTVIKPLHVCRQVETVKLKSAMHCCENYRVRILLKRSSEVSLSHPHTSDALPPGQHVYTAKKTKTSRSLFLLCETFSKRRIICIWRDAISGAPKRKIKWNKSLRYQIFMTEMRPFISCLAWSKWITISKGLIFQSGWSAWTEDRWALVAWFSYAK